MIAWLPPYVQSAKIPPGLESSGYFVGAMFTHFQRTVKRVSWVAQIVWGIEETRFTYRENSRGILATEGGCRLPGFAQSAKSSRAGKHGLFCGGQLTHFQRTA